MTLGSPLGRLHGVGCSAARIRSWAEVEWHGIDDAVSWPLPQVSTKYVIEAANGPTTPEGDQVLRKRGITVLPDIYTNGGACFTP